MGCDSSKPVAVPRPDDARIKKVHEALLLYMNQGGAENLRLVCWDYGGQGTFYGLHHLSIGRQSVYILMFNMKWFPKPGNPGLASAGQKDHIAYLRFWLDSIGVHAVDPTDGTVAPIIIVGTHKDQVPDPEQHEYISDLLDETFRGKLVWSSSVQRFEKATLPSGRGKLWFFPVDNTKGNADPVIAEIKKVVQRVVKREKYVNEIVPYEWLRVLERLQAPDMKSSITLSEVMDIGKECGMSSKEGASLEDQTVAMLKRFNDLGQLMYHPEASLRDVVILDPVNYLVDPATMVICQHGMHENESHKEARVKEPRMYARLRDGILDTRLLEILWKDRPEQIETLERLLVKFGFFVPILQDEQSTSAAAVREGRRYLVPHVLPPTLTLDTALKPRLLGYFIFAEKKVMQEIRTAGYVTTAELKRDGFLPMGLGPAVAGRIVGACQCLYAMKLADMQVPKP